MAVDPNQLKELFLEVISCEHCPLSDSALKRDALDNLPQPGYVGSRYSEGRVLLIGQNPGITSDRFVDDDRRYSALLRNLRDSKTTEAYEALLDFLRQLIPSWPVHGNYFPLEECELCLDQIAFINLARCRTNNNRPPSKRMISNCSSLHLTKWVEVLEPKVIVCIGKWAFDNLPSKVCASYQGRIEFMNRQRSLSSSERIENRERVVSLVRMGTKNMADQDPIPQPASFAITPPHSTPINASRPSAVQPIDSSIGSASDNWDFVSYYKSRKFSHTEIRRNGEAFAHCSKRSANIFPRFDRSTSTRNVLKDAGFPEKWNESDGGYRFLGVNLECLCKLLCIPVRSDYRQE